ncbi:hypothetical protein DM598_18210 [Escherichia coli]|nr:hypothetical protein [Escherichia coli]
MSNLIPDKIAKSIKQTVYNEADKVNYLSRTRTENGNFLAQLVSMPSVGGKLSQYMRKDAVRTYIKDAILNRYSKDKTGEAKPNDVEEIILETFKIDACLIEDNSKNKTSLYYGDNGNKIIVVADGTVLKWETALRKALMLIASKNLVELNDKSVSILLTLFARYQKISPSDLKYIQKALLVCNAQAYIYGDG